MTSSREPVLPLGLNDLHGLKLLIEMYLTYLRKEAPPAKARAEKRQTLLEIRQKLIRALLAKRDPVTIPLTMREWHALRDAVAGAHWLIRNRIASSTERDDLLATLERLRQEIARTISGTSSV